MNIVQKLLDSSDYGGTLEKVSAIVLHHSGGSEKSMYSTFDNPNNYVSAHYSVDTDGIIYRYVPDTNVAWHAGASLWWDMNWLNYYSLGIEVVSTDGKTYTDAQRTSTRELLDFLVDKYSIEEENIVRHCDITQNNVWNMENKILAPDKDSEKSGRKWDLWENFFNWVPFSVYRNQKPMQHDYAQIVLDKYGIEWLDVLNDPQAFLDSTDIDAIKNVALLLFQNMNERIKNLEENNTPDLWQYNQGSSADCTMYALYTAVSNTMDREFDEDTLKKFNERAWEFAEEKGWTHPTNKNINKTDDLWRELFQDLYQYPFIQASQLQQLLEGEFAVISVDRDIDHAMTLTRQNDTLWIIDNYYGEKKQNIYPLTDEKIMQVMVVRK